MAEFMPLDGDKIETILADPGRVPKVSETTVVKGQFGLDQSSGTGKILKYFILQNVKIYERTMLRTQRPGKQLY